jgi:demethylmenaquinone methyltransferase / 2-methoxy-6-polyprenyl-1,4-benzoquinol methylase
LNKTLATNLHKGSVDVQDVKPYQSETEGKKKQISTMFDRIAPSYDRINHLFSLGFDVSWRKKAIREIKKKPLDNLLDVCTGTGDFAITSAKKGVAKQITGIDISKRMLQIGQKKLANKGLAQQVKLEYGDVENMTFADNTFEAITVAFGVRNFENLEKGLIEMKRVLKPGGKVIILELGMPRSNMFKNLYKVYFQKFLSNAAGLISKDREAYQYLNKSVDAFPEKEQFTEILNKIGFNNCKWDSLTAGICILYTGEK